MFRRITLLAAPLVFAGTIAQATTLISPGLRLTNEEFVLCTVVNTGTKSITVKAEALTAGGLSVDEDDLTVAPGGQADFATTDITGDAHCRFGAFKKTDVRASIGVVPPDFSRTLVTLPAY